LGIFSSTPEDKNSSRLSIQNNSKWNILFIKNFLLNSNKYYK
jgi:hypothetical protein